jgi:hypothetical protein
MMTAAGEGSDRSVGRRPGQPDSDFRVARAFGGGATDAGPSSPSGRVRIHERIRAIIDDLNKYGPDMVNRAARNTSDGSAVDAKRDLDEAVQHLKSAVKAVQKLRA